MENLKTTDFNGNLKLVPSFIKSPFSPGNCTYICNDTTKNEQELVKKAQEIWQAQKSEENWIRGLNLQDIQTKFRQVLL